MDAHIASLIPPLGILVRVNTFIVAAVAELLFLPPLGILEKKEEPEQKKRVVEIVLSTPIGDSHEDRHV